MYCTVAVSLLLHVTILDISVLAARLPSVITSESNQHNVAADAFTPASPYQSQQSITNNRVWTSQSPSRQIVPPGHDYTTTTILPPAAEKTTTNSQNMDGKSMRNKMLQSSTEETLGTIKFKTLYGWQTTTAIVSFLAILLIIFVCAFMNMDPRRR